MSPAQVAALVAPSSVSRQTVLQWLAAHGTLSLPDLTSSACVSCCVCADGVRARWSPGVADYEWNSAKDFLRVRTTAQQAEMLLGGIEFHAFTHDSASTQLFRFDRLTTNSRAIT
jgi:hypothetical protein